MTSQDSNLLVPYVVSRGFGSTSFFLVSSPWGTVTISSWECSSWAVTVMLMLGYPWGSVYVYTGNVQVFVFLCACAYDRSVENRCILWL